jgi:hypothetical protein
MDQILSLRGPHISFDVQGPIIAMIIMMNTTMIAIAIMMIYFLYIANHPI